ncbi:hypothetical protein P5673_009543 [Acropora cervicornis]|uniref:Uncharacterized protein n=1 Tax=Acropora cervicornis TaxID=6130 RepID=A0AAD9QRF8_ACRCE|nr:hypothetical protein P5673_009543 [Acropora cervicornis]
MKTQYLVCCSLVLLLSSLYVVEAFSPSCQKHKNGQKQCGRAEKFREDTEFTAMLEKRRAQRRREICLTARELKCDKELESK